MTRLGRRHTGLIVDVVRVRHLERAVGSVHGDLGLDVEGRGTLRRHVDGKRFALLQVSSVTKLPGLFDDTFLK